VTHDQTEAMTLADEILLMNDGEIVQRGSPREVYNHPAHRFGGWFLGNPGMNFVPHEVSRNGGDGEIRRPLFAQTMSIEGHDGRTEVIVGVRPEHLTVGTDASADGVRARIKHAAIVTGGQQLLALDVDGVGMKAKVSAGSRYRVGDLVLLSCRYDDVSFFDADGAKLSITLKQRTARG